MKKRIILGLSVLATIMVLSVLSGCSSGSAGSSVPLTTKPAVAYTTAPTTTSLYSRGPSYSTDGYQSAPVTQAPPLTNISTSDWGKVYTSQDFQTVQRMVVRNGSLQLVVSDVAAALDNIAKLAADLGGYVVTSQKWKDGERNMGIISIRVMAENYDQAVASLRALAMSVTRESTNSQDVTEEYVDLDSKVKNLEATETQLLKILESAATTEDVLSIQRELTSVRGEIEQAKGRMQYLERTSSTSLIEIQLSEAVLDVKFSASKVRVDTGESITFTCECGGGFPPYNYLWDFGDGNTSVEKSPNYSYNQAGTYYVSLKVTDDKGYTNSVTRSEYITVIGSWNPGSVAAGAWNGFSAFGRGLLNILIWLGIFSPVWIIIGGIIGFIVYRRRKK